MHPSRVDVHLIFRQSCRLAAELAGLSKHHERPSNLPRRHPSTYLHSCCCNHPTNHPPPPKRKKLSSLSVALFVSTDLGPPCFKPTRSWIGGRTRVEAHVTRTAELRRIFCRRPATDKRPIYHVLERPREQGSRTSIAAVGFASLSWPWPLQSGGGGGGAARPRLRSVLSSQNSQPPPPQSTPTAGPTDSIADGRGRRGIAHTTFPDREVDGCGP